MMMAAIQGTPWRLNMLLSFSGGLNFAEEYIKGLQERRSLLWLQRTSYKDQASMKA
jgi:hypothetical protein